MDDRSTTRLRAATGRRRNEQARRDILDSALALAAEDLERLTMDRIAAHAGVGKQTVYRWWPSKWEVVLDALLERAEQEVPQHRPEDGQDATDRLEAFLADTFAAVTRPGGVAPLLRALMAHSQFDPTFAALWRERFVLPRRAVLADLVRRERDQGRVRTDLPPDAAADLLFGALWYRLLVGHAELDDAYARHLADTVRPPAHGPVRAHAGEAAPPSRS